MLLKLALILISTSCLALPKDTVIIRGASMAPCLQNGQKVEVRYKDFEISKDSIVVFKHKNKTITKRVVALPNDKFSIMKKDKCYQLKINNKVQKTLSEKNYCFERKMISYLSEAYKNKIPKLSYLVLGEVPSGSEDSSLFGLIEKKQIIGVLTNIKCN